MLHYCHVFILVISNAEYYLCVFFFHEVTLDPWAEAHVSMLWNPTLGTERKQQISQN